MEKYSYAIDLPSLFNHQELAIQMLTKEHTFVHLQKADDKMLMQHPWSGLMEMFMKHARTRDAINLLESVFPIIISLLEQGANDYVVSMLNYQIAVGEIGDLDKFTDLLEENIIKPFPTVEGGVMTLAEQFLQKGLLQGMQQGTQQTLKKLIKNMAANGMNKQQIIKIAGVSEKELQELLS